VAAEMTTFDGSDNADPHIEPPHPDSLEARASIALKVLALINVAGAVLAVFPPELPASLLHAVTFNVAALALAGLQVLEARGLDRRRPWAVAAVRPLLLVLVAYGVVAMLVGVGEGRIRVPFESVAAIWALLGAWDGTLGRRADGRSLALVGSVVLLGALMLFGRPVFGWGGLLDVRPTDLHATIEADCGAPGAGLPPTITVTYDWSWARPGALSNGLDIVVIGWTGTDADGRPIYLFDKDPATGTGITPGKRGYPSIDMATQVAAGSPASRNWGVDLGEQGLQPGSIGLQLRRARDDPPAPGPLAITASYVHLGIWHSEPVSVTCSW
jgi:hypothetical protein